MRGVFYPIRMQLDFMIGVHESGHAACLLHLAGPGVVDRVTTQGIWYVKPRNDFDRLIITGVSQPLDFLDWPNATAVLPTSKTRKKFGKRCPAAFQNGDAH